MSDILGKNERVKKMDRIEKLTDADKIQKPFEPAIYPAGANRHRRIVKWYMTQHASLDCDLINQMR
jgi:hypothetical protein